MPKQYSSPEIRLHHISGDIQIFSSLGVIMVGNNVIRESLYGGFIPGVGPLQREGSNLYLELNNLPAEPSFEVNRAVHAMAGQIGARNFGHFWVDVVSVFQFALQFNNLMFFDAEYLVSPSTIPFHRETFDLLSAASPHPLNFHEVGPSSLIKVNRLLYVEGLHDIWRPRISFANFARSLSGLAASSISEQRRAELDKYSRLLHISRRDSPNRLRMANELEVEEFLTAKGFDVIVRSEFSIAESIYLFSRARAISGENGSNLMNILFCPVGCHMIEFHNPDLVKWDFRNFGSAAQAQYSCLVGRYVDNTSSDQANAPLRSRPWRIDLDELTQLLSDIF